MPKARSSSVSRIRANATTATRASNSRMLCDWMTARFGRCRSPSKRVEPPFKRKPRSQPEHHLIVITGLQDCHVVIVGDVHKPVGLVDAPRPNAGEGMHKRFRFSDACGRTISEDVFDEGVDALESLPVSGLPVQVVFPPLSGPSENALAQGSRS